MLATFLIPAIKSALTLDYNEPVHQFYNIQLQDYNHCCARVGLYNTLRIPPTLMPESEISTNNSWFNSHKNNTDYSL